MLIALAALILLAPAAQARPIDPPATTTEELPHVLEHTFDAYPKAMTPLDIARAQEKTYSTYGQPAPLRKPAPVVATTDGIAPLPFVLGIAGALIVGLAAGSGLHVMRTRRHSTLAT
jgi:hypothetical protein